MMRFLFSVTLGLISAGAVLAQVTVSGTGKIPVSVAPFTGTSAESAVHIINADLNRTLLIDSHPGTGQRFTVSGTINNGTLTGQLSDGANLMWTKTYPVEGNLRRAVHEFSDDVSLTLTKVPGFATSRVAAISSVTGHKEIYLFDIDGANAIELTNDKTISAHPKWNGDGTVIAYTSYKSGYPDSYTIKLGANLRTRVAFFPGINTGAAFSPNGHDLALTLSKDGNPLIYIMSSGGGSAHRLTNGHGTETSPSWSPDGSHIVYDSDERGSVQLYVVSSDGGAPTRLATGSGYSAEPDWSPDGNKIAFTGRVGGEFQVGVYDIPTGHAEILTTNGGQEPSWTRNSRDLIYAKSGSLYVLDTVTRQSERLDNNLTQLSEAAVSR